MDLASRHHIRSAFQATQTPIQPQIQIPHDDSTQLQSKTPFEELTHQNPFDELEIETKIQNPYDELETNVNESELGKLNAREGLEPLLGGGPVLSIQDLLLNDSRLSPDGNGSVIEKNNQIQPTDGHKWWAAVICGFIFGLISSPPAYYVTSTLLTSAGGVTTMTGPGPGFVGLLLHSIIFILIIRLVLW